MRYFAFFYSFYTMKTKFQSKETIDITDDVIGFIFAKYDEIGLDPLKGYDRIEIAFKKIHQKGITGLKDRIYKEHEFDYLSVMTTCTDDSPRTIQRICNKK